MGMLSNIIGTFSDYFRIGKSGVRLKNSSGSLHIRNAGDSAYAALDALSIKVQGVEMLNYISGTTAATTGWYRIANSAINVGNCNAIVKVDFSGTGVKGSVVFTANVVDGYAYTPNQVFYITNDATKGLTQVRIVYHLTPASHYVYVEIYNPTALAITYNVTFLNNTGWTMVTPSTAGSIPSGYNYVTRILVNYTTANFKCHYEEEKYSAPADTFGNDGDTFTDIGAGLVYFKASGAWTLMLTL